MVYKKNDKLYNSIEKVLNRWQYLDPSDIKECTEELVNELRSIGIIPVLWEREEEK